MLDAVTIRPVEASDYADFLRLLPELEVDDPAPDSARWQAEMMPGTLVAAQSGRVVAYIFVNVIRELGYVRHLVVSPEARGGGVGLRMMQTVADHFRAKGARTICLNVKPTNAPAIRLYERVGMRPAYASTALRVPWSLVDAMPPAEVGVGSRIVEPADDAALEAAFRLPEGTLDSHRQKPGRVLLMLEDPQTGEPLGLAAFNPAFPGAFPFCARRLSLAGNLFRAIRPHAPPLVEHIQVVIEDDAALTRGLLDAGATIRLDILHYRGDL